MSPELAKAIEEVREAHKRAYWPDPVVSLSLYQAVGRMLEALDAEAQAPQPEPAQGIPKPFADLVFGLSDAVRRQFSPGDAYKSLQAKAAEALGREP